MEALIIVIQMFLFLLRFMENILIDHPKYQKYLNMLTFILNGSNLIIVKEIIHHHKKFQ